MSMTIAEKIFAKTSDKKEIGAGEIVMANIDVVMTHDLTVSLFIDAFEKIGVPRVWDSEKIVVVFDHKVPADSLDAAVNHSIMRKFVKDQGINNLCDVREGVYHQVLLEKGHMALGGVIVETNSHTRIHGVLGIFSTAIYSNDMYMVFATGKLWFKVPETIKFNIEGTLPDYTYAKDVVLNIIGQTSTDGTTYEVCELAGETTWNMSVFDRIVMCNMVMGMGGKTGLVKPDQKTIDYIKARSKEPYGIINGDEDAPSLKIMDVCRSSISTGKIEDS